MYELIYTRCRQGIDITQKGRKISSDGYKVYSCTRDVMEEGKVDLPFLVNSAQAKQSCTDPGFMDDAYLYYVPDTGAGFFINFHPIPFDAKAKGDYAHRPGNFINHALIGDFSRVYPYKMFQDDSIWEAKTKGEAYYYENPPADDGLPPERGGIDDPPGRCQFDEIRAFISDGRQEALKKAVAFLIAQYQEEPEKRKYLVIKDDSSKNIELWIAAIECAFPPRLASAIPFATRMDKFTNTNRYTVKNGMYQPQMNLQDPNQKQRLRAMIVGVDERDKTNVNASRPLANSPFVLLDGKQKQASFDADISNSYFRLITQFDGEHQKFCGEFLQAFPELKINAEIYGLYEMFTVLTKPSIDTRTLANTLGRLNKYNASGTGIIKEIYSRVNQDVSRFLSEDFSCALNIISWLLSTSKNAGDAGAMQRLTPVVCDGFAAVIFGKNDNTLKRSLWTQIKSTGFKTDAARVITDMEKIKTNLSNLQAFNSADAAAFMAIYLDAASLIGVDKQNAGAIVKLGIKICCDNNDTKSLQEIVSSLSQIKTINSQDLLFAIVKSADADKKFGEFVLKYIIDNDANIIVTSEALRSFCEKLKSEGLEHLAGLALMKRVNILNKPADIERLIETALEMKFIGEESLAKVFEAVDDKVNYADDKLVELLQTKRPCGAKCRVSAHFYAIRILELNNRKKQNLKEEFTKLKDQGFPAIITDITEEKYINKLVEYLIKTDLTGEEQSLIVDILLKAPKEYYSVYLDKLIDTAAKQQEKWNALFKYVFEGKSKQIDDIIVQALVDSKKSEKSLAELGVLITDEKIRKYHDEDIGGRVLEKLAAQKKPGLFGKIFG